jgi:hypothetical protein
MNVRKVLYSEIIKSSRVLTDTVYSAHMTDEELTMRLDSAVKTLYSIMTQKDESLFFKEVQLQEINGQCQLPEDFFKILSVFVRMGDFEYPLDRTTLQARGQGKTTYDYPSYHLRTNSINFTPKNTSYPIFMYYLPLPTGPLMKPFAVVGDGLNTTTYKVEFTSPGTTGNDYTVTLVGGGVAGAEECSVVGESITIKIEPGVSTATQVKAAVAASLTVSPLITVDVTKKGIVELGTMTLAGGSDGWMCVSHEDDWLISMLCIEICLKEESDPSQFQKMNANDLEAINSYLSPRDNGSVVRIRDIESERTYHGRPLGLMRR